MSTPPKKTRYMLRDRSSGSAGTSASTTPTGKKVTFSSLDETSERSIDDDEQSVSSDESFCEILTSETESLSSSGEEDIEMLDMAFERAYTCSRRCFQTRAVEPVERSSLLLLDKDILAIEGDILASEDSSAASEISSVPGCYGSIGCGTSSEVTSDTSDSEKESSAKRRKIETPHPRGSRGRGGRGRRSRGRGSRVGGDRGGRGGSSHGRGGRSGRNEDDSSTKSSGNDSGEQEQLKWTIGSILTSTTNQPAPLQLPPFSYASGPAPRTKNAKTPIQVFQLMFTAVILQSIVQQTKLFASQKGIDLEFCVEELQAFIGLNIAMGLLHLPQVRDYWSTNEILATPWFPSIMSRDRFFKILRYLHLVDSSKQKKRGEEGYDILYKVRPLIDHLGAVFPKYYQPSRQLSIDEMMIGTRCRVSFLQYIPKKPTRFGIKVWVLAEAKSGYVLDFQVYTGASDGEKTDKNIGLGHKVVMQLMEAYQGKGHCLFIDNFYTSPALLLELLDKGTYCTGTVCTNRRNFPDALRPSKKHQMGSFRFATCRKAKLTAAWWRDRRDVYVMSTMHNLSATTVLKRPKGEREKQPTPCPTAIVDYNKWMGGVDLADQLLSYYSMTTRRTLKWWKKVFWRLVDIAIINSWIIFHTNYPNSEIKSQKQFRIKLAEELVQPLLTLRASPQCPHYLKNYKGRRPTTQVTRLNGKHFPYKRSTRGRCAICCKQVSPTTGKKKDIKTQNFCPKCDTFLCFGTCFERYHTHSSI